LTFRALTSYASVPFTTGILDFNLFAIPMVGADICGFNGDTTVELCARWQEVGAFYPFSRNHNTIGAIAQDPPSLGDVVVKAARNALLTRYRLHNLLYTLFYENRYYGGPVIRPMFTLAPQDDLALSIDTQFLWGDSLLVLPVLNEGDQHVEAYFTAGLWFDFADYSLMSDNLEVGVHLSLHAPVDTIRLAVRGGSILTLQKPEVTIPQTRRNPLEIVAFLDQNGQASGSLYIDDGDTLFEFQDTIGSYYQFTANQVSINRSRICLDLF
jgi:lysosomal alpha-glucosidase